MKYLPIAALVVSLIAFFQVGQLAQRLQTIVGQMQTITEQTLGATVISTATTDTIETFRTNVNTSLAALASDNVSTTTAYTWTQAQAILGALTIGATATTTISTSGTVGIASSSPLGQLGIGTTGTSTISGVKFCAFFQDEAGRGMWIKLATSGNVVFATSTTACN